MKEQINTRYPLSDAAYDVIVILHEKSKALEAYDGYLSDVQHDNQLRQALVAIRHDEQRHIESLKSHLPRLLVNQPQNLRSSDQPQSDDVRNSLEPEASAEKEMD